MSNVNVAEVTETAPVSNIADVLEVARAWRRGVNRAADRCRRAHPHSRAEQSRAHERSDLHDRRRAHDEQHLVVVRHRRSIPSRVDDLNPEEIENIEIVKGPSAATLYGTDAANGVIVITTKRGRAGAARWTVYGEGGVLSDWNQYPTAYSLAGHSPGSTTYRDCVLSQIALAGNCLADSVRTLNLFDNDGLTPVGLGNRYQAGRRWRRHGARSLLPLGRARTGSRHARAAEFERNRFNSEQPPIHDYRPPEPAREEQLPSEHEHGHHAEARRERQHGIHRPRSAVLARVETPTAGSDRRRTAAEDISTRRCASAGLGTPLNGYRAWTPGYTWQEKRASASTASLGPPMRTGGRQAGSRARRTSVWTSRIASKTICCVAVKARRLRDVSQRIQENWRTDIRNVSLDLAAAHVPAARVAEHQDDRGHAVRELSVRSQRRRARICRRERNGWCRRGADAAEATTLQKTFGLFIEQQLGFRDRLFITGALRTDQNSAFGTDFQNVIYPKASLSWILSDEAFFPQLGWLNQLRLRAAYGSSGVQPGLTTHCARSRRRRSTCRDRSSGVRLFGRRQP